MYRYRKKNYKINKHDNTSKENKLCIKNMLKEFSVFSLYANRHNYLRLSFQLIQKNENVLTHCPASPEKEDQHAAGSPAALTQLALCLRLAIDLKGRKLATRRNPQ
jgi:hypothetical protein